jgi:hypothetical protein
LARWTKRPGLEGAFLRLCGGPWPFRVCTSASHTPLDVGVSLVLGLVLVFVLYPVFRDMEKRPKTMYIVFLVMLLLTVAYIL